MAEGADLPSLISEFQTVTSSLEPEDERQVGEMSLDSQDEVEDHLEKAQSAFMFENMREVLERVMQNKSLAECEDDGEDATEEAYERLDADIGQLIEAYMREEQRHQAAHEALLRKKAEVEEMLASLEAIQQQLALAQGWGVGEEEEEEEEAGALTADDTTVELEEERAALAGLSSEWEGLQREKAEMASEIQALEDALDSLQEGQQQEVVSGGEEEAMAVTTEEEEEEEVKAEMQDLRDRIDWTKNVVGVLEDLYGSSVDVAEDQHQPDDGAVSGGKALVVTLTYPSHHALRLRLGMGAEGSPTVRLLSAQLEAPPSLAPPRGRGVSPPVSLSDILEVAAGLGSPDDLVFIAREVGLRVRAQAAVREQIRELQQRYIVKLSEAGDELTVTLPEGVVATCQLLAGYPELPGSLRLTSLVGVGGWKDAELAVTCRELNHGLLDDHQQAAAASLLSLVQDLHGRISHLNNSSSNTGSQHEGSGDEQEAMGGGEKNDSAP